MDIRQATVSRGSPLFTRNTPHHTGRRSAWHAECQPTQSAGELYAKILYVHSGPKLGIPFIVSFSQPDLYHALTWPELSYVAVDPQGRVVGYILAKM